MQQVKAERHERTEKLKDMFDELDIDGSGDLALEEIRISLLAKGYTDHFIDVRFFSVDIILSF